VNGPRPAHSYAGRGRKLDYDLGIEQLDAEGEVLSDE